MNPIFAAFSCLQYVLWHAGSHWGILGHCLLFQSLPTFLLGRLANAHSCLEFLASVSKWAANDSKPVKYCDSLVNSAVPSFGRAGIINLPVITWLFSRFLYGQRLDKNSNVYKWINFHFAVCFSAHYRSSIISLIAATLGPAPRWV